MADMRHAGIGWPNGQHPEPLWSIPGSTFVMLDSETRFHYANLRRGRPEASVLWRPVGTPPATVRYSSRQYVQSLLMHWDEQEHWGSEHLIVGNEFNLNYERGDDYDDWDYEGMAGVYSRIAALLDNTRIRLRREFRDRGQSVVLHFPAWAPDHYLREYRKVWQWAANDYDAIDFHAYGDLASIQDAYRWYRSNFPNHQLFLTEWHGLGRWDTDSEREILKWLAQVAWDDPLFGGASFFIWKWWVGKDATDEWDIEGNEAREQLFWSPPDIETVWAESEAAA